MSRLWKLIVGLAVLTAGSLVQLSCFGTGTNTTTGGGTVTTTGTGSTTVTGTGTGMGGGFVY